MWAMRNAGISSAVGTRESIKEPVSNCPSASYFSSSPALSRKNWARSIIFCMRRYSRPPGRPPVSAAALYQSLPPCAQPPACCPTPDGWAWTTGWVTEAARPQRVSGQPVAYGYLVWPLPHSRGTIHEGAFAARGIFGQHLYMHPKEKVVIVVWSALPKPFGTAPVRADDFFAVVAQALR